MVTLFIYSKFSKASERLTKLMGPHMGSMGFTFVCIDNPVMRKRILKDTRYSVTSVPCLLEITPNGFTKYDGNDAFQVVRTLVERFSRPPPFRRPQPQSQPQSQPQPPSSKKVTFKEPVREQPLATSIEDLDEDEDEDEDRIFLNSGIQIEPPVPPPAIKTKSDNLINAAKQFEAERGIEEKKFTQNGMVY